MNLQQTVEHAFIEHFNHPASNVFRAPGRVNLIGEHTDYNDGFVLPCAINFETIVAGRKRDDNLVTVIALDYQQQDCFDLSKPIERHSSLHWANYVRGEAKNLQAAGLSLVGCELAISGNIPQGAGLSSSASLEVSLGLAFSTLAKLLLSSKANALNGQAAENNFVGCNCGIMDQLISAEGEADKALLIDCRTLETQAIAMPAGISVMIINSNVERGLVDSAYNERRQQCEQAAAFFQVDALRDVDWQHYLTHEQQLIAQCSLEVAKRAKHVISENERTVKAASCLSNNDIEQLSRLMALSHQSMRDDFDITINEIDCLVEMIAACLGSEGGVRMTGGGFGGCVVALVPDNLVTSVTATIEELYPLKTQLHADIYVCTAHTGATVLR